MGTSPMSSAPLRRYWRTCFTRWVRVSRSEQRIQGAGEIRLDSADRRIAAVVVDEQPVPDFQDEHQPDPLLAIDAAAYVIAHDAAHDAGVVIAAVQAAIGKQHVIDETPPRPGEPAGQGNGETHLAAVDRLVGDIALGEPLENDLRAQAADFQVLR